ncbi:MAG: SDR family NAD(P)-dependent oxidoreductase [Ignavibacteria bacterium]|jgi:NAD(P)-dependent dehydrogenase (short-subunit alcohol dehydrogenase family)|nr:SDR family NAD(P)-dependent oxidoreductase [Ignavibacteria bacterium]MCU7504279.1 SDR family NAD(P)-dependent oxidoreductase [Ignavibacteria bacterium]MCU7516124.1 SDR family NAD(P)-dependent oxidoreductase [Ignavibacteria bacterium]
MEGSLKGKTIIITGGSSGIGAAAAKALSGKGAEVIITGRSQQTKVIAEEIGSSYFIVDYSRFSEIRNFAQSLLDKYPHIDVLVNNVGGIIPERRITPDGHEMTFQVNHLSGFLLTSLLRKRLEESKAVVINTSSGAHLYGRMDFDDLESEKDYNAMRVYANSKMMNILHAMEITKRFRNVSAVSFHPGGVATSFAREFSGFMKFIYSSPFKGAYLISPLKGANTLLWLIDGRPVQDWMPGGYYYKRKPGRKNRQVTPAAALRLWEVSAKLTGSETQQL